MRLFNIKIPKKLLFLIIIFGAFNKLNYSVNKFSKALFTIGSVLISTNQQISNNDFPEKDLEKFLNNEYGNQIINNVQDSYESTYSMNEYELSARNKIAEIKSQIINLRNINTQKEKQNKRILSNDSVNNTSNSNSTSNSTTKAKGLEEINLNVIGIQGMPNEIRYLYQVKTKNQLSIIVQCHETNDGSIWFEKTPSGIVKQSTDMFFEGNCNDSKNEFWTFKNIISEKNIQEAVISFIIIPKSEAAMNQHRVQYVNNNSIENILEAKEYIIAGFQYYGVIVMFNTQLLPTMVLKIGSENNAIDLDTLDLIDKVSDMFTDLTDPDFYKSKFNLLGTETTKLDGFLMKNYQDSNQFAQAIMNGNIDGIINSLQGFIKNSSLTELLQSFINNILQSIIVSDVIYSPFIGEQLTYKCTNWDSLLPPAALDFLISVDGTANKIASVTSNVINFVNNWRWAIEIVINWQFFLNWMCWWCAKMNANTQGTAVIDKFLKWANGFLEICTLTMQNVRTFVNYVRNCPAGKDCCFVPSIISANYKGLISCNTKLYGNQTNFQCRTIDSNEIIESHSLNSNIFYNEQKFAINPVNFCQAIAHDADALKDPFFHGLGNLVEDIMILGKKIGIITSQEEIDKVNEFFDFSLESVCSELYTSNGTRRMLHEIYPGGKDTDHIFNKQSNISFEEHMRQLGYINPFKPQKNQIKEKWNKNIAELRDYISSTSLLIKKKVIDNNMGNSNNIAQDILKVTLLLSTIIILEKMKKKMKNIHLENGKGNVSIKYENKKSLALNYD